LTGPQAFFQQVSAFFRLPIPLGKTEKKHRKEGIFGSKDRLACPRGRPKKSFLEQNNWTFFFYPLNYEELWRPFAQRFRPQPGAISQKSVSGEVRPAYPDIVQIADFC
jgi:hypothetical protein